MKRSPATNPRTALVALSFAVAVALLWCGRPCAAAQGPAGAEVVPLDQAEGVRVTGVAFHGNDHFSPRRLRKLTGVQPGDLITPYEGEALAQQIETAYREKGYSLAAVHTLIRIVGPLARLVQGGRFPRRSEEGRGPVPRQGLSGRGRRGLRQLQRGHASRHAARGRLRRPPLPRERRLVRGQCPFPGML